MSEYSHDTSLAGILRNCYATSNLKCKWSQVSNSGTTARLPSTRKPVNAARQMHNLWFYCEKLQKTHHFLPKNFITLMRFFGVIICHHPMLPAVSDISCTYYFIAMQQMAEHVNFIYSCMIFKSFADIWLHEQDSSPSNYSLRIIL